MASFKEHQLARSQGQQRLSMSSTSSHNLPIRHTTARHHSHSVSLGSVNASHRVTRRKSMTSSTANNVAAIVAAIKVVDESPEIGENPLARRSFTMRAGGARGPETAASVTKAGGSLVDGPRDEYMHDPDGGAVGVNDYADEGSVIMDENPTTANDHRSRARVRRASEGAHLSKSEGKRSSGELRCEKCGKGYKHSSCLTKHLWEHTPEWTYTSKLLISKHQQVQLLEAASVLVGMNPNPSPSSEAPNKVGDSDPSSASPTASGSSELHEDDISSAETTPPPMNEHAFGHDRYGIGKSKRHSHNGSSFSRSYQSAPSSSSLPRHLPPMGTSFANPYQPASRRPSTAGGSATKYAVADEEDASLAAAVQSLCSFGTPRSGHVHLPADAPPVPPVPARFVEENNRISGHFPPSLLQGDFTLQPPPLTHRISDERDVKMGGLRRPNPEDDEEYDNRSMSHGRSDEDDDGIFGRMEE